MTCRYSNTDWLDVLYNSVRKTPGGVVDAARFLTERRGRSIHPESLRAKLRAVNGDEISLSMADLLTEWMEEKAGGADYAHDWVQAHAIQHGLSVDVIPTSTGDLCDEIDAIQEKAMQIGAASGGVLGVTVDSLADKKLTQDERDQIIDLLRDLRAKAHSMEWNLARAGKGA